ncbi:unnamed protein product, partial [marine sediment metagenome]
GATPTSHNYYSETNLHVVWHTKNRLPLLAPTVEPATQRVFSPRHHGRGTAQDRLKRITRYDDEP